MDMGFGTLVHPGDSMRGPPSKTFVGSLCRSRHAAHAIRESASFRVFPWQKIFPHVLSVISANSCSTPVQEMHFFALLAFRDNPSLTFRTFPLPIEPSRTFPNHKLFFGCF